MLDARICSFIMHDRPSSSVLAQLEGEVAEGNRNFDFGYHLR